MITSPKPKTVKSGANVSFDCLAYSYGSLQYHWKRPENSINNVIVQNLPTMYSLIITNAQVSNEGNYCCVATNECGAEDTISCAWLEVKSKEYITLAMYMRNIIIVSTASIQFVIQPNVSAKYKQNSTDVTPFECLAIGHARAGNIRYQWQKYYLSNKKWMRPSDRIMDVTSRHLKFRVIKEQDEGIYRCVATNDDDMVVSNGSEVVVYG